MTYERFIEILEPIFSRSTIYDIYTDLLKHQMDLLDDSYDAIVEDEAEFTSSEYVLDLIIDGWFDDKDIIEYFRHYVDEWYYRDEVVLMIGKQIQFEYHDDKYDAKKALEEWVEQHQHEEWGKEE